MPAWNYAVMFGVPKIVFSRMPRRSAPVHAHEAGHALIMFYYVYILQSLQKPERKYVGLTTDIGRRIAEHNAGHSVHTNKFRPWKIVTCIAFDTYEKALLFEAYLKSHAGRAFSAKRF